MRNSFTPAKTAILTRPHTDQTLAQRRNHQPPRPWSKQRTPTPPLHRLLPALPLLGAAAPSHARSPRARSREHRARVSSTLVPRVLRALYAVARPAEQNHRHEPRETEAELGVCTQ